MAITLNRVDVEWRRGDDGLGGTYVFSPRPRFTRPGVVQKQVEFKIPLKDGSLVQLLNNDSRTISIRGILVVRNSNFDDLDQLRQEFLSGIGNGPGQFHLISNKGQANSKHIFYKGVPTRINIDRQRNSHFLFYSLDILLADPTEFEV